MRRRFIADEVSVDRAALTGAHAAHLARVLRARAGQEFEVAADGRVRRARVISVSDDRVEFELHEDVPVALAAPVSLYLAVFKFDRMEWAVEKATELGVAHIVPLIAARTDAHLATAATKRVERWRRIALEAAEQSRRPSPPEIATPVKLKREVLPTEGTRIVLAESERHVTLKVALAQHSPQSPVALAVGPEGGWTDAELKLFSGAHWQPASLGNTILRTETAAIAALAVVMAEITY
ncbi:MAG: 16S rRNA (uracil(1498)-N(3))-methyltransferase [Terriglobales bacterium]